MTNINVGLKQNNKRKYKTKVKTLIKRLEKYDQSLPVAILSDNGDQVDVCKVTKQKGEWSDYVNYEGKQVVVLE